VDRLWNRIMKVATRPPLRRLVALDRMLRAGQYPNSRTAAEELEVNPRTIHRDLAFLRDSWGAPLACGVAGKEPFYVRRFPWEK
jgi:predicted DNA-binding transcriptional regulator YafY